MFTIPETLPLYPASAIAQFGSTLVIAPHPDDESLGCGGAIALLRQMNFRVRVLVISDGTKSHPNSRTFPQNALAALRQQETLAALAVLGVESQDATFLRLKDGSLPFKGEAGFKSAIALVRAYLLALPPFSTVILPSRSDPHPDHRAAWELIASAIAELGLSPLQIEYPIWDWDPEQRGKYSSCHSATAWRLDISAVLSHKLNAIAQHRSQTTDLINDDPEGFRLTPQMLANFAHPWEVYYSIKVTK